MESQEITQLLDRVAGGDGTAQRELIDRVYERLRIIAAGQSRFARSGDSLQPTILVHEAYVKLFGTGVDRRWNGRNHFFSAAATAMRQIAVDHARRRVAQKRGGGWDRVSLSGLEMTPENGDVDIIELDEAISALAKLSERQARIVELRFFGGLTVDETAQTLSVSPRTVELEWRVAKAWLCARLLEGHQA